MDAPQAEELGQAIVAIRPGQIGALPLVHPVLMRQRMSQKLPPSMIDWVRVYSTSEPVT